MDRRTLIPADARKDALLALMCLCMASATSGCGIDGHSQTPTLKAADCFSQIHRGTRDDRQHDDQRLTYLQQQVSGWLTEYDVPSAAISFVSESAIQWTLVCGEQQPGIRANTETLYNTASIAKPMVGEILLRAVSRELASLDEPMVHHWTDPDIADDSRRLQLTARVAMAHQTGFTNWRRMSGGHLTFQWNPGERTGYSGEGVLYVVRFLENKLGTPFENIARDFLLGPMAMNNTSFVGEEWFANRVAWRRLGSGAWSEPDINEEPLGAGDVWTTSEDYAKFLVATMRNHGIGDDMIAARRSISSDEVPRWCGPGKASIETCPDRMGFGVAWYVYEYSDHTLLAHNGSNEGEKTLVILVPEREMGFVILTNGENGKAVIGKIAKKLYNNPSFFELEGY